MSNFNNVLFAILLFCYNSSSFIMKTHNTNVILKCNNNNNNNDRERYNPFQKKYYMPRDLNTNKTNIPKKYLLTRPSYIEEIKRLNSKNVSIQTESILGDTNNEYLNTTETENEKENEAPRVRIILNKSNFLKSLGINIENEDNEETNGYFEEDEDTGKKKYVETKNSKSKNFEAIKNYDVTFKHVGGYDNIKQELNQCIDILKNYEKYAKYNVRIPKGLILEGPPGTGKTLLAKALAGEAKCSFIPVAGPDFQQKYVGVGTARIKELFELAKKNVPCIIFIDEIDAVGRKRSTDGETSSSERDNTLNSLLVELDGFKNNTGIFLIAATNRIDLLDSALIRPGRIDKKIYIGIPDRATREAIIDIHIRGKPYCHSTINIDELVDVTDGLTGAQIENLLNEAMLNALKMNNTFFSYTDFDIVMNKMLAGWQPTEHDFTSNIIDHIAIHEMGHTIVGLLSKHHSKVTKVVINLSSPQSPGYTIFEGSSSNIYIREALFEHLMILLGGRIAEEIFYNISVTTGAINDFEEALKLAEKMIVYYGMGTNIIYPSSSEKYKELIDTEVINLINKAYNYAYLIIKNSKEFIEETSEILKREKIIKVNRLNNLLDTKYKGLRKLKIDFE